VGGLMKKDTIIKISKFFIALFISVGFSVSNIINSYYLFISMMIISFIFVFHEFKINLITGKWVLLKKFFIISYFLFLTYFILFGNILLYYANNTEPYENSEIDAVVVLGTGLHRDGAIFTLLSRLDTTIEIAHKNTTVPVIVSSGYRMMDSLSSADNMKKHLIAKDIDADRILTNYKATSTLESITVATTIIKEELEIENPNILFVTSDYHTARTILVCSELGINGYVHPSESYNFVGFILHESFALVHTFFTYKIAY
jgi:vancomycin permeability regulator SanA